MPKTTFFRLRGEKQEAIMRAAIREFTANGFTRTKIGDIAQKAGVAKGSMYQYFEDKKELFIYCSEWGLDVFMKKLDERVQISEMDVFEYFQDNIAKSETVEEEREWAVFVQTLAGEPGLADSSMKAMYKIGDVYGKKLIQNSKRKGVIRKDISDELLMDYFLAVTHRFKMRWIGRYVDFTTEQTEEQRLAMENEMKEMLELLRNGMGC